MCPSGCMSSVSLKPSLHSLCSLLIDTNRICFQPWISLCTVRPFTEYSCTVIVFYLDEHWLSKILLWCVKKKKKTSFTPQAITVSKIWTPFEEVKQCMTWQNDVTVFKGEMCNADNTHLKWAQVLDLDPTDLVSSTLCQIQCRQHWIWAKWAQHCMYIGHVIII